MPRKPLIDFPRVAAAAERLVADGQESNARNVRALLGAGSMATVLKHLQAWQKMRAPQAGEVPLPAELVLVLGRFADQRVALATATLQERLSALQSEMDEVIREAENCAAQMGELVQDLSQARESGAALQGKVTLLSSELSAAKKEAAAARTGLVRAEARLEGLQALKDELTQARAALTEERARRIAAERQLKKPSTTKARQRKAPPK